MRSVIKDAERHQGRCEAFCLDFDIAVQGGSFEEVYGSLKEAVADYVARVSELPKSDQDRLLRRHMPFWSPFWSRLRFSLALLYSASRSRGNVDDERHGYTLTCVA
jgi:hypothetical protein